MSAQAGAAVATLRTDDQTAAGFDSAKKNLKDFHDTMKTAKGQMLPVAEFFKGGMFVGGGMAGTSALLSNYTSLSDATQALSGKMPGLTSAMGGASAATRQLGTDAGQAESTLGKLGMTIAAVSAAGYGLTQAYITLSPTVSTVIGTIKTGISTYSQWIGSHRELIGAFGMAETAAAMLQAANVRNIGATQIAAAQTLLLSNTEAGAAIIKTVFSKATYVSIAAKMKDGTASLYNAACDKIAASAKTGLTLATVRQGVAAGLVSVKNLALAAATGVLGLAAKACAGAWVVLTGVLGLSPLGAVLIAAAALAAGITALVAWFHSSSKAAEKNSKALLKNAEAAEKNVQAHEKNLKKWDDFAKVDNLRLQRLKQLADVENKTASQTAEAAQLVNELNESVHGLGLTFNETTGKIGGLDDMTEDLLKDQQARVRLSQLKEELQAVNQAIRDLAATDNHEGRSDKMDSLQNKKTSILEQIKITEKGGTEEVLGKTPEQIIKARVDAHEKGEKEIREAEKKTAEERQKKLKEIDDEHYKALNMIVQLDAEIRRHHQNALENELEILREQVFERQENLRLAIEQKKILGENTDAEQESLDKLADLLASKEAIVREKFQKEAEQYSLDFAESETERLRKEEETASDKRMGQLIENDPMSALSTVQAQLAKAKADAEAARQNVLDTISAAKADGVVDENEKKRIDAVKKQYQLANQLQEKLTAQQEKAQEKIREGVEAALKEQSDPGSPLAAYQAGTAEAQQKFLENKMQSQSPEVAAMKDIYKMVEDNFQRQRRQNENVESAMSGIVIEGVGP